MTAPDLVVELVRTPAHALVVLRGELDADAEPEVQAALDAAGAGAVPVVLDLRGLEFIDSTGLRLVLAADRRLRARGVAFSVVRGPQHVQRPFTSAGLDELVPFVDEPPA